jgi:phage terminase Nu1 subunit (DNA packaging protein)
MSVTKSAEKALADVPVGAAVADVGDRYLVVYPGRPWLRIAKDQQRATALKVHAAHLRLVKTDRRPR